MEKQRKVFSKIYDQYIDKIYRFIFFKVSSEEIAEDLTSETFLKTWEVYKNQKLNPKNQKEIENPQAFLYRIARNLVTDHYREKAKNQIVSAENASIIDPRENLEERAMLSSELERVMKVMADLKEDYQNAIIWRYIDELPIEEVAYLLDRTEQNTRVLLHRSLEALREKLNVEEKKKLS